MYGEISLFSGNANLPFAKRVCQRLGMSLAGARVGTFSDGEIRVEVEANVRGRDVFILQSTCAPANDNLMELLIMVEACKRSSAGRIVRSRPYRPEVETDDHLDLHRLSFRYSRRHYGHLEPLIRAINAGAAVD